MNISRKLRNSGIVAAALISAVSVNAAVYTNPSGGKWETPANWDIGGVPGGGDSTVIAGSAGGQAVVMDMDSWMYITNNALQHNATTYRVSSFNLGTTETASMDLDIGAGNTWQMTANGTFHVGQNSGSDGTLNVLSGTCLWEASRIHIAQNAGSTGAINVIGPDATFIAARASGEISMSVGTGGAGTFYISDGSMQSRMGVAIEGSGVFDVAGSDVVSIGVGSRSSLDGNWQHKSNGVFRVGIDVGGITPVLVDDVEDDGFGGNATFAEGALLEPYFIDGVQTGKWTVLIAEGDITDEGIAFAPSITDTNWALNVTNGMLEVWYGLGESGYVPAQGPDIIYNPGTMVWDGEAGDNAWDNPTNWVSDANNELPEVGSATLQLDATNGYPVYTPDESSRNYSRIHVGLNGNGRLDVTGNGYTLRGTSAGTYTIGGNGNTGTVNVDGGATLNVGASMVNVGNSGSVGIINCLNGGRFIFGRESGGISGRIGNSGEGYLTIVDNGRFYTRAGLAVAAGGGTGVVTVQGAGGQVLIGTEGSLDGSWVQYAGGTLRSLVTSDGLTTIFIDDKGDDGGGTQGNVTFEAGSLLDVDFSGYDGENGSWDVMTWEGTLTDNGLAFAPGVDESIWSFSFVDTDATNGVDTLRIESAGFITDPTVVPNITDASASGNTISLTWDSEPIIGYNVLSRSDLVLGTWATNIAGITGMGPSTMTNVTAVGDTQFYKIEAFGQ